MKASAVLPVALLVAGALAGLRLAGDVAARESRAARSRADAGQVGRVRLDRAWPVMGTLFHVTVLAADSGVARAALAAAKSAVFRVDSLMSTYKPGSEVSRLNAAAGSGRWIALSPETAEVLEASLRWAERSGGAFDPTVGPLVDVWGFRDGEPARPRAARRDSAARLVGYEGVRLDRPRRRARLERAGMRLDFGAIAKGYALDLAVAAMRGAGADAGMADLGGNVSVFGAPPGGGSSWRLGIRHPRRPETTLASLAVPSGSVATSGDYEQFVVHDGVRYSHIMDARTGEPARGVAQVTVVATAGIVADALSTALFVMGPAAGSRFLAAEKLDVEVTAIWVRDAGGRRIGRDDVICAGRGVDRVVILLPKERARSQEGDECRTSLDSWGR